MIQKKNSMFHTKRRLEMRTLILQTIQVTAAIAIGGVIFAQFGPPRGPGGFGGPGGMPASNITLLMMPEVQREIALTDTQKARVNELQGDLQAYMRENMSGINFQEIQSLSEEERDKRFRDVRTNHEAQIKQIDAKLNRGLDGKQLARLTQLVYQRDAIAGLSRPEVASQLKLTDDQKAKLAELSSTTIRPFGQRCEGFSSRQGHPIIAHRFIGNGTRLRKLVPQRETAA